MARWTASAKWAAGPALDGQRDMPLALRLSEGLGITCSAAKLGSNTFELARLELSHRIVVDHVYLLADLEERSVGLLVPNNVAAMQG